MMSSNGMDGGKPNIDGKIEAWKKDKIFKQVAWRS